MHHNQKGVQRYQNIVLCQIILRGVIFTALTSVDNAIGGLLVPKDIVVSVGSSVLTSYTTDFSYNTPLTN